MKKLSIWAESRSKCDFQHGTEHGTRSCEGVELDHAAGWVGPNGPGR